MPGHLVRVADTVCRQKHADMGSSQAGSGRMLNKELICAVVTRAKNRARWLWPTLPVAGLKALKSSVAIPAAAQSCRSTTACCELILRMYTSYVASCCLYRTQLPRGVARLTLTGSNTCQPSFDPCQELNKAVYVCTHA